MPKQSLSELLAEIENDKVRSILKSGDLEKHYTDAARETLAREWLRMEREQRELAGRLTAATGRLSDALAE